MDGFLLIDKPEGISSFGVVSKVRGVWRAKLREQDESPKKAKVGHTGTLDPMATGLMVLVLGAYTKRAGELSKLDKVYEAEITLGEVSTTGDREGELSFQNLRRPTPEEVKQAIKKFTGEIMQLPPLYSAIKINGKRAYKIAREGKTVKLEARKVNIYSITDIKYHYPKLKFKTHVGSGTYIRSLAEDIGQELGTGAYLSSLKRTKVGNFDVDDAIVIDNLDYPKLLRSLKTGLQ